MRTLHSQEIRHVAGGAVVVDVNTVEQYVKVTLTAFYGLVKLPIVNVDWTKWASRKNPA